MNQFLASLKNITPTQLRLAVFLALLSVGTICSIFQPAFFGGYLFLAIVLAMMAPEIKNSYQDTDIVLAGTCLGMILFGFITFQKLVFSSTPSWFVA